MRTLLTASLEEAIGSESANNGGLTKHIEAVKPQQLAKAAVSKESRGREEKSFMRKNRRRQSVSEAAGSVGDFLRDKQHRSSDPVGLVKTQKRGSPTPRARARATTINAGSSRR